MPFTLADRPPVRAAERVIKIWSRSTRRARREIVESSGRARDQGATVMFGGCPIDPRRGLRLAGSFLASTDGRNRSSPIIGALAYGIPPVEASHYRSDGAHALLPAGIFRVLSSWVHQVDAPTLSPSWPPAPEAEERSGIGAVPFPLLKSEARLTSRARRAVTMRPRPWPAVLDHDRLGDRYPRGRLSLGKKRPVRAA